MSMTGANPSAGTVRINFDVAPMTDQLVRELMTEAHVGTKKELFMNALTLLSWAVDAVRRGQRIVALHEDRQTVQEIDLPIFLAVRPRADYGKMVFGAQSGDFIKIDATKDYGTVKGKQEGEASS